MGRKSFTRSKHWPAIHKDYEYGLPESNSHHNSWETFEFLVEFVPNGRDFRWLHLQRWRRAQQKAEKVDTFVSRRESHEKVCWLNCSIFFVSMRVVGCERALKVPNLYCLVQKTSQVRVLVSVEFGRFCHRHTHTHRTCAVDKFCFVGAPQQGAADVAKVSWRIFLGCEQANTESTDMASGCFWESGANNFTSSLVFLTKGGGCGLVVVWLLR